MAGIRSLNGNNGNVLNNVLFKGMNLADLNNVSLARSNLGLVGSLTSSSPYVNISAPFNGLTDQTVSVNASSNATSNTLVVYNSSGKIITNFLAPSSGTSMDFNASTLTNINAVNTGYIQTPPLVGSVSIMNAARTRPNMVIFDNGNVSCDYGQLSTAGIRCSTFKQYASGDTITFKNNIATTDLFTIDTAGNIACTGNLITSGTGTSTVFANLLRCDLLKPRAVNGDIVFNNTPSIGLPIEIMRLSTSGFVGIGTTIPLSALDVGPGTVSGNILVANNYVMGVNMVTTSKFRPVSSNANTIFQNWDGVQITTIDNSGNLQASSSIQATTYVQGNSYLRAGNGTSAGIVDFWDLNSYKWRISSSGGYLAFTNDSTGTADTVGTGNPTNNKFFCDKNGVLTTVGGVCTNSLTPYSGNDITVNNKNLKNVANITKQLWSQVALTFATFTFGSPTLASFAKPYNTYSTATSSSLQTIRTTIPFTYNGEKAIRFTYYISGITTGTVDIYMGLFNVAGTHLFTISNTASYGIVTSQQDAISLTNSTLPGGMSSLTIGTTYYLYWSEKASVASSQYTIGNAEISCLF